MTSVGRNQLPAKFKKYFRKNGGLIKTLCTLHAQLTYERWSWSPAETCSYPVLQYRRKQLSLFNQLADWFRINFWQDGWGSISTVKGRIEPMHLSVADLCPWDWSCSISGSHMSFVTGIVIFVTSIVVFVTGIVVFVTGIVVFVTGIVIFCHGYCRLCHRYCHLCHGYCHLCHGYCPSLSRVLSSLSRVLSSLSRVLSLNTNHLGQFIAF